MRCNTLKAEIQHRGYQFRMLRIGRGHSHEEAFAAGAKLIIDLICSGEVTVEQIKQQAS